MILVVLAGLLAISVLLVIRRHGMLGLQEGSKASYAMLRGVAVLILLGMALAAMAQVILPAELISEWMGGESGMTGILIGTVVGCIVPGGPYVVLPLAGSVMASGAGVGPMAAFITAWSVTPITRTLMWEVPFLGPRFTIARFIVSLPFPIIAGLVTPPVYDLFT